MSELTVRQKTILELVYSTPTITGQEMSERLQVSEKTVQRDFAAIRKLGIELIREGGKPYGHWVINIGDK